MHEKEPQSVLSTRLTRSSETVMAAVFLKGEYYSERFSDDLRQVMQKLGVPKTVITNPRLGDEHENQQRSRVLGDYRGYKQNREIFTGFPENLHWYQAELTREEVGSLRCVNYSYWNELTDQTHLVKDAAKNIQNGKVVFRVSNERFLGLAEEIGQGRSNLEPIIVWGEDANSPQTILEGHVRATAIALAGDKAPRVINAIVGLRKSDHKPVTTD